MTNLLDGIHNNMLDGFLHGHDTLDVLLLVITVDGTAQDELQQPA